MPALRPHMGPTAFVTWTAPGSALPVSWQTAKARLTTIEATAPATGTG